ncbi:MAG: hypothetical protein D3924_17295 [Candidatus Electrothrix sp. AR4]|nr:hypothetical protein [Candidatus Electrothrix sp. AR4]
MLSCRDAFFYVVLQKKNKQRKTMKIGKIIFVGLTAFCLLLPASSALAERKKVYFQHTTDKTLQMDCVESKDRNDSFPHYTCYDDESNGQEVTPGAEWRLVEVEKVCFMHRVRDTIRVCVEITVPEASSTSFCYACAIGDQTPKSFEPTKKWEKLAADDSRCAPRLQSFDVPRSMVIPSLPEWSEDDATKK